MNLQKAKPLIDNKLPWMPYRAFSVKNKFRNRKNMFFFVFYPFFFIFSERDQEIYMNNRILLHKMEKIDGKTGLLNPLNLGKQSSGFQKFHQFGVLSKRINYHKTVENENMVDFFFF